MINGKEELEAILKKYEIEYQDVCYILSTIFSVKGIRENRDIEFILKPQKREKLLKNYIESGGNGYNPYSEVIIFNENLQCHFNPYRIFDIDDEKLFEDTYSEKLEDGARVVKLELYAALKILYNKIKDKKDIDLIKDKGFWTESFQKEVNKYLEIAKEKGFSIFEGNRQEKWKEIFARENLYIFGTGGIGKTLFKKIEREGLSDKINGFLVSKKSAEFLYSKRIYDFSEIDKSNSNILLAVSFFNIVETKKLLQDMGFVNIEETYMFLEKY
ncbi:MAG: hypothetical protein IKJ01_07335 [Lachnospiraceae bacterium]|nr:hypothetical protein [Lachnospiraceae bacterium]